MSDSSILRLTGMGIPPYSIRGASQTLVNIEAAEQLARTINGSLIDLSASQLRKYATTISVADQDAPALDGIWPGQTLTVDCISELAFETNTGGPERTVVPGSEREADGFTFYRPRLTMRVTSLRTTTDEWGAETGWELRMEEV